MSFNKKHLSFTTILLTSSLFLVACGDKSEEPLEETTQTTSERDYSQISQQIKVDSYLNKIEDYNFEGYFYPSGISEYDRTIMSKTVNKYSNNPYLFDMLYAMTNGDFDEKKLVKDFNKLYIQIKELRAAIADMRNVDTIAAFNNKTTSLVSFKEISKKHQDSIHSVYDNIKNLEFENEEGQLLQKFHLYYLDYWILELDNQFETISRLTEKQQKTYNVTDFSLRLSNYGEEGSFVDTYIILLEAKNLKEIGLEELEKENTKESDKNKKETEE